MKLSLDELNIIAGGVVGNQGGEEVLSDFPIYTGEDTTIKGMDPFVTVGNDKYYIGKTTNIYKNGVYKDSGKLTSGTYDSIGFYLIINEKKVLCTRIHFYTMKFFSRSYL